MPNRKPTQTPKKPALDLPRALAPRPGRPLLDRQGVRQLPERGKGRAPGGRPKLFPGRTGGR